MTVTCDGRHIEWTGSKAASVAFTADALDHSKSTLYIFADNSVSDDGAKSKTGINPSVMRLYSFRITEGGTLKRNFVPCVRTADAVAGLYDMVEGKFYGNAGTGAFVTPLPFARELTSGTYEITESFVFVAPKMESALKVADGATVTLKIAAGVEVMLRGGDAFEVWGAGAGIEVPANATLKVTGAGQLIAYGGKGANGCNGLNAGNGSANGSNGNFTSGAGGAGGWGGGGAGAGIGGHGGNGGGGGNGGKSVTGYNWSHTDISGNRGDDGGNGHNGGTCGTVSIEGMVKVVATGGAAGAANGAGGAKGDWAWKEGSTYYFGGWGGGGGGGGTGGYGGGGGGSGAYLSRYYWNTFKDMPGWGAGGKGTANGASGGASSRDGDDVHGGAGGAKGAAGARGGSGQLTVAGSAKAYAKEGRYSVGRLSGTVGIFYDNGQLLWVSGGTSSNLSYSVVNNGTGELGTGWHVVKGSVSRKNRILVSGAANLVLLHNSSLTVDCRDIKGTDQYAPGIEVCDDNSLRVFGVESGLLTAMGSDEAAGIGTAWRFNWSSGVGNCNSCGSISFYGGTVTAQGGEESAGIGGGHEGAGGTVTINGGTVTAQGAYRAAGIGGGYGGAGGSLTLRPCVYKIDDNHWREGVSVSFVVPDDLRVVSAIGDRTWMDGNRYFAANRDPGRTMGFTFEVTDPACRLMGSNTLTVGPVDFSYELEDSLLPRAEEIVLDSLDYALPNGEVASARNVYPIHKCAKVSVLSQSWYRATGDLTQSELTVQGKVNLILCEDVKLTVNGGIRVGEGNALNIFCQEAGTGRLVAIGSENCAGIGGGNGGTGGTVTINGGVVTATGGYASAGIGGAGGTVTINGGVVTATGGGGGAGIGGGEYGAGGKVTINGGMVTAMGGGAAAGIGGGYEGAGGTVTINGGTVTAQGKNSAAGIGGGYAGAGGAVTINGGVVTATGGNAGAGIGGGSGGAGGTVTINGGVVTATGGGAGAGIGGGGHGADAAVTLDEMKVVVVEGMYGNGHSYVKIAEKPICVGGTIEFVDGVWIVTPNDGVTAVTITGLPEGATVAVPPTVTKVKGVADAQIKVRARGVDGEGAVVTHDITGAFAVSGGAIALNENGSVTIGGESIPVKPTIGDLGDDAAEPFVVGEGSAAVTVRAIPGLKYELVRGESVEAIAAESSIPPYQTVAVETATVATVTLTDGEPPEGAAFYKVVVSVP